MHYIKNTGALMLAALGILAAGFLPSYAQDLSVPVCNVVVYDDKSALEDGKRRTETCRADLIGLQNTGK